jgi:hypothetical protein
LSGPAAFPVDLAIAESQPEMLLDGGSTTELIVGMVDVTPVPSGSVCALVDAGLPAGAVVGPLGVDILFGTNSGAPVAPGTYPLGLAGEALTGPSAALFVAATGDGGGPTYFSTSGTATLTAVGSTVTGSFTATLGLYGETDAGLPGIIADAGMLSGTFSAPYCP